MRKIAASLLGVSSLALSVTTWAASTTITFDDLVGAGPVPANYMGLTWTGWTYYDSPQPPYNPSSSPQRIYNDPRNNDNLIEFNQTVTFEGLWMAGYSQGQYVIGYNSGVPIFTSIAQLADGSEFGNWINVNWPGVDAISVYANDVGGINDYYILDDIKYSTGTSVPDSGSTLALLGGALGMLGLVARRFRK
ncbi:MAG TPA: VPDSG-CTERM sorting domain-containing protein [Verrucomicrobiota bacterium]|nr:VPDSG-CTERM sorting domain-containing protein [Verrucomicrobiota bacterium]